LLLSTKTFEPNEIFGFDSRARGFKTIVGAHGVSHRLNILDKPTKMKRIAPTPFLPSSVLFSPIV
jgi:hypothetical protein